jgi:hypothetical protein
VSKLGKWLAIASAIMLVVCVAPIMLYAAFGPADGNPIGLGLLMVFGWLIFTVSGVIGVILWVLGIVKERKRGNYRW